MGVGVGVSVGVGVGVGVGQGVTLTKFLTVSKCYCIRHLVPFLDI